MPQFETFPNAPITEALIDIQIQPPQDMSLDKLENLHASIQKEYPEKQKRMLWEGSIQLKDEKPPFQTTQAKVMGYLFKEADQRKAVQFRLDGFTFSRFRPYTNWPDVSEEAWRLYEIYREGSKPIRVTRLATRYINSIEIPSKLFDYDDYFTTAPQIPPDLPQQLAHFFTRLVIPFQKEAVSAIVTLTPSEKPDPIRSAVILDIDVFKDLSKLELRPDSPKIYEIFDILRRVKNEIFFGSVTERTKELFR